MRQLFTREHVTLKVPTIGHRFQQCANPIPRVQPCTKNTSIPDPYFQDGYIDIVLLYVS